MVGMEEGICPHTRSLDDPEQMEEERRLCYVGMTRAKRRLYLLRAFRRTIFGTADVREPSRFLADIPRRLVAGSPVGRAPAVSSAARAESARPAGGSWVEQRRTQSDQVRRQRAAVDAPPPTAPPRRTDLARPARPALPEPTPTPLLRREASFHPGEAVRHPIFGEGTVISSQVVGPDEEITVAFEAQGVKRLLAQYARLEKVNGR